MSWSLRVARIAGIDLRIHWTFFLLLLWLGGSYVVAGAGVGGAFFGLAMLLSVFACVVLHEFGHAMAARQFGIATRDITLLPIGGVARLERMPTEPLQELWVAVAGPLINVVIAGSLFVVVALNLGFARITPAELLLPSFGSYLVSLMWINVGLVIFNMIPAFPMDGGRVLRSILAARGDRLRATDIAAKVGQAFAILFGVLGLFFNPLLLFVAIFIYLGAEAEARTERMISVLSGIPVKDAMLSRFKTFLPEDTLDDARNELLAGSQQDFPVDLGQQQWAIVHRDDLIAGLRELGPGVPVSDVMRIVPAPVSPEDPLDRAMQTMRESELSAIPVVDQHRLAGLLTTANLGELLMVREAAQGFAASRAETEAVHQAVDELRLHA